MVSGLSARLPLFYVLDLIAQRYGQLPWTIDTSDPATLSGIRRAMIVMQMENQRDESIVKAHRTGRGRVTSG
jgi:hypothetical protein